MDPLGNFVLLICLHSLLTPDSQQPHDWDGLSPPGLSDVVLLQRRNVGHVGTVFKLRDAGLHVLRPVGDDDGDVELDVRAGELDVSWPGRSQLTKRAHLPQFFLPLPRYYLGPRLSLNTDRKYLTFRELLAALHSNAAFSSELSECVCVCVCVSERKS